MIEIPIGKALIAVKTENKEARCVGCFFRRIGDACLMKDLSCYEVDRKDGKNVIFKLVDYKGDKK